MRCIIVDDEPLAREAMEMLLEEFGNLELVGKFNSALGAKVYMENNTVDLIFLDIQMPGVTGLEFARTIPKTTLVIFTTAYMEFALESYEVEAVDYLVKPVVAEKFCRAVEKAGFYHSLLYSEVKNGIEYNSEVYEGYFYVKSERRFVKIIKEDILFVEGLKDYVIIHLNERKVITKMTIKNILEILSNRNFFRVNRSYIVNMDCIDSFDTNDIYIGRNEIAIGPSYRDGFLEHVLKK